MPEVDVIAPGAGEPLWFLDTLMQAKLPMARANGALTVFEQLAPPGSATPLHRHDATDEYFYVLAGEVTFHSAAGAQRCQAGSFVSVPRGTPHAFRITSVEPARLLVLSAPGTFEGFVRAVSRPATAVSLPPAGPPPPPEAIAQLAAVGAQHDVTLLGPPPGAAI